MEICMKSLSGQGCKSPVTVYFCSTALGRAAALLGRPSEKGRVEDLLVMAPLLVHVRVCSSGFSILIYCSNGA